MVQDSLCLGCMEEKGTAQKCPYCGYEEGSAPESLLHLPPGAVLRNKYLIGRALGQGGFGITYLAWDLNLNIKLAIKEYLPQQLAIRGSARGEVHVLNRSLEEEFSYGLQKFLEEARTLAHFVEHPNIVSVRDYFAENNTAYLVMSYHDGVTLQEYLQNRGGRIPIEHAFELLMPLLDALKEIHSYGFLHRDISPDNLLVNARGRVVLIDFGAARQAMGEKTKSLSVIMKAGYTPLEQYQSKGKQGPWTDIYSLAATFYRSITGELPPEALNRITDDLLKPLSEYGIEVETQKEAALKKALALKSEDRYLTVKDFHEALIREKPPDIKDVPAGLEVTKPVFKGHTADQEAGIASYGDRKASRADVSTGSFKPGAVKTFLKDKKYIGRIAAAVLAAGLLLLGAIWLFSDEPEIYYIVYEESGGIPLYDLEIGARVVDPSWEWAFKTGENYTGPGESKPVTWIVVAKNHYGEPDGHVTLLAEELIGRFLFDDSTDRGSNRGSNHWGDSGKADAERGLKPWLNASAIHQGEGFYAAFSDCFKSLVLVTGVPNREWSEESWYVTDNKVFIPSTTELGDRDHDRTYKIGKTYPFFDDAGSADRIAWLADESAEYWTRSPALYACSVRIVNESGVFNNKSVSDGPYGVRPVLNLCADTMVSGRAD